MVEAAPKSWPEEQTVGEAMVLDGVALAEDVKSRVAGLASRFLSERGRKPGLAAVLVGENPASQVYVRSKIKTALERGLESFEHRLPAETSEDDVLALIRRLNADDAVDGILVQLPLPSHMREDAAIATIAPEKDVDGFHVINAGLLVTGKPAFVPCTPLGCLALAKKASPKLSGMNAVVVGRSNIVGKPVAHLLLAEDCTVTIAHSRTRDLAAVVRTADLLVAAVGRAEMITGEWIKPGAIVIDVGINRVSGANGKPKLTGDVHYESALTVASAITPVPGGVGPMTVAFLMENTCKAAYRRAGIVLPGGFL